MPLRHVINTDIMESASKRCECSAVSEMPYHRAGRSHRDHCHARFARREFRHGRAAFSRGLYLPAICQCVRHASYVSDALRSRQTSGRQLRKELGDHLRCKFFENAHLSGEIAVAQMSYRQFENRQMPLRNDLNEQTFAH
jgi:hypothetical protein